MWKGQETELEQGVFLGVREICLEESEVRFVWGRLIE